MSKVITKMGGCSTTKKKLGIQFVNKDDKSILGGTFQILDKDMVESKESISPKIELGQSYITYGCRLCKNKYAYRCGCCGRVVCYDGSARKNAVCPVCGAMGDVPKARGVEITRSSAEGRISESITETPQGQIVQITFSNVTWLKFDNVKNHYGVGHYRCEPKVHVVYDKERIEFHGYNISNMDEGVYYMIGAKDDFTIECNVDTSTIKPHPGGFLYIQLGIISANINLEGGTFSIDGRTVAKVGSRFKMKLARVSGVYEVYINDRKMGEKGLNEINATKIVFGFNHGSHDCSSLSHAYISDIKMTQCAW